MSEDDYCVYARNILGNLNSIPNPVTGFTADPSFQNSDPMSSGTSMNIGVMFLIGMILVFMMMNLKKKQKTE